MQGGRASGQASGVGWVRRGGCAVEVVEGALGDLGVCVCRGGGERRVKG